MSDIKPTVWVFGDSFSEEVSDLPNHNQDTRWQYVNEYLNGIPYPSWGKLISQNLSYNYRNFAAYNSYRDEYLNNGNSNDSMFNTLSYYSHNFEKNDIVFVGFTESTRFQFPYDNNDVNIHPNMAGFPTYLEEFPGYIRNSQFNRIFLEKLLYNREINREWYIHSLMIKMKFLEELSITKNFHLFYWTWNYTFDNTILSMNLSNRFWIFHQLDGYLNKSKYDYFQLLNKNCNDMATIASETDNQILDGHTGKIGNEVHAKIITNLIKKKLDI